MKSYCSTNKNYYQSEAECVEVLIENLGRNKYHAGLGPLNIYKCDLCDGFHLTSKGERHPILDDPEIKKRIFRLQQASDWIGR